MNLSISQKKNFINGLKNAGMKIICKCVEVYKLYEGYDFNENLNVSPELKKKEINYRN